MCTSAEEMTKEDHAHVARMCFPLLTGLAGKEKFEALRIGDAARARLTAAPRTMTQDYDAEVAVKFAYPGVTEEGDIFELEFIAKKMGSKLEHWEISTNVSVSDWVHGEHVDLTRTGGEAPAWAAVDKETQLRVAPEDKAGFRGTVPPGAALRLLGPPHAGFQKLRGLDGAVGWVRGKYLSPQRRDGATAPPGCTSVACMEHADRAHIALELRKALSKMSHAAAIPMGDHMAVTINRVESSPGPGLCVVRVMGMNGHQMVARQCKFAMQFTAKKRGHGAKEWDLGFTQEGLKKLDKDVPLYPPDFKTPEKRGFDLKTAFDLVKDTGFHDSDGMQVHGGYGSPKSPPRGGYSGAGAGSASPQSR